MQEKKEEFVDISGSFEPTDTDNGIQFTPPRKSKPPKKKSGFKKAGIIAAIFVLLCGSVAVAAMSGLLNSPRAEVSTEESSAKNQNSVKESSVSEKTESVEEESTPSYEPTGKFTSDNKVFSKEILEELDEAVTARYVVLYDATSDKIIFERNAKEKCYPASTTKMLTAIVASKIIPKDTVITVGDEIELIGFDSSTAGLQKGMKMTYEALLDALLLPSGNDAAYTIAVNAARIYTGNDKLSNEEAVKTFMGLVNEAAKEIGCTGTHYVTPDGWHDDDHYTTATDLAKIAAYARTVPMIKASCGKAEAEWELIQDSSSDDDSFGDSGISEASDEGNESDDEEVSLPTSMYWTNSNAMLQVGSENYSRYCTGIKTGFTDEAGTSVVASAEMDGHTFIAVVMFGETLYKKYEDANILFTEGFKLYNLNYTYGTDSANDTE